MDFQRIQYFLTTARLLSFTKAASECHIAQTAMSRHISKLETELGVKLFDRTHRSVSLTPAGMVFLKETRELVERYGAAVSRTQLVARGFDGSLRLGFGPYENHLILKPLEEFTRLYPKVEVVCSQHGYKDLVENLTNGSLDLIISMYCCPKVIEGAVYKDISKKELQLVVGRQHPLHSRNSIGLGDLADVDFVSHCEKDGPCTQDSFLAMCDSYGFRPRSVVSANSLEAKLLEVKLFRKAALLPSFVVSGLDHDVRHFAMPSPSQPLPPFCATYLPSRASPAAKAFYDMLG
jgi:DNA-binding transcriptional LysR family regulator